MTWENLASITGLCVICACHLSYIQVFKIRQDTEITVSLVGALGRASYYCCLFTASDRVGQSGGFKGKAAKVRVTVLKVFSSLLWCYSHDKQLEVRTVLGLPELALKRKMSLGLDFIFWPLLCVKDCFLWLLSQFSFRNLRRTVHPSNLFWCVLNAWYGAQPLSVGCRKRT